MLCQLSSAQSELQANCLDVRSNASARHETQKKDSGFGYRLRQTPGRGSHDGALTMEMQDLQTAKHLHQMQCLQWMLKLSHS